MVPGILGKKIGMTQIFDEEGRRIPVTVLEAGPCVVQRIKTMDKDGYCAVQIGFSDTKEYRLNKPQREYLKAKKLPPKKFVREIRCSEDPGVEVGAQITNSMFQEGDFLDICGVSKGKGFQGGMKRCGWSGGKETHGSKSHRAPGSIGCSAYPSRVFKGHGMPGQMGNKNTTVQNVKVVDVNTDDNTITIKGAVPGFNGRYVEILFAIKKEMAPREEKEEQQPQEDVREEVKEQQPQDAQEEVKEQQPQDAPEGAQDAQEPEDTKDAPDPQVDDKGGKDAGEQEGKEGSKE